MKDTTLLNHLKDYMSLRQVSIITGIPYDTIKKASSGARKLSSERHRQLEALLKEVKELSKHRIIKKRKRSKKKYKVEDFNKTFKSVLIFEDKEFYYCENASVCIFMHLKANKIIKALSKIAKKDKNKFLNWRVGVFIKIVKCDATEPFSFLLHPLMIFDDVFIKHLENFEESLKVKACLEKNVYKANYMEVRLWLLQYKTDYKRKYSDKKYI